LKIHRLLNDTIGEMVAAKPDRFAGLATVPLQSVPMAIKELDRAVTKLGLRGVNISSFVKGRDLDDKGLHPFWTKAQDLNVPIYIHPAGAKDDRLQRYFLWNSVGQPYEEAMAITALIYGGVLDKFPRLNFVVAHGGGFVPHYDGRLDRNFYRSEHKYGLKAPPSKYLKRLFFDTCVYNPEVAKNLAKKVGGSRLIMGSDYPVGEIDPIAFVKKDRSLSKTARDGILGKTAAKLLKIGA
jgi:aminocarboxymuconate-semialdehyde decarboxylase